MSSIIRSDYQLRMKSESSENDLGVSFSSSDQYLPLLDEGFDLHPQKVVETINSNVAHPHPKRLAMGRDNTGALNTQFDVNTAQFLLDLGFGGITNGTPDRSKTFAAQLRKGSVTGMVAAGIKANSMSLSASSGGLVQPSFDLRAMSEKKISAPTIDPPSDAVTPFRFAMAIAILDGALADTVNAFNLEVSNNLRVGPYRTSSLQAAYLEYGTQDITGDVTVLYESEVYNDLVRGTATGSVDLIFGSAMAEYDGSDWNTDDYFVSSENAVTWDGTALANDSISGVSPLTLTTLTPSSGDVVVQNPVVLRLNAVEVPDAPESIGDGDVVEQQLQFSITAPDDRTTDAFNVYYGQI